MTQPPSTSMFDDDPFGKVKQEAAQAGTLSSRQVNEIHKKSDVNVGPNSQHHTLGTDRNQAASGSHVHGGKDSKLIGDGMGLAISGAKGGNPALGSLITMLNKVISFTDNTTA